MAVATFGAGCFWGVEVAFRKMKGVTDVAVGYSGGAKAHPSYQDVCSGETGHAEVARVEYDPAQVTYWELLGTFFSIHDPTQVDRQGWDVGTQYRSVIFTHDDVQAEEAARAKAMLDDSKRYKAPVATAIEPAGDFWRAEEYHQRYLEKVGRAKCH